MLPCIFPAENRLLYGFAHSLKTSLQLCPEPSIVRPVADQDIYAFKTLSNTAVWLWILVAALAPPKLRAQHFNPARQLSVRVLDQNGHGVLAKILLWIGSEPHLVAYTDPGGNAVLSGLAARDYELVVTVCADEVHRDQISMTNEPFRNELVRVRRLGLWPAGGVVSIDELGIPKAAQDSYAAAKHASVAGNWKKALAGFKKAVTVYPSYAKAYNGLGVVLAVTARLPEAEAAFRRSIELNPGSAEFHSNLGELLLDRNRTDEARKECETSLQLGGSSSLCIGLLVEAMLLMNDDSPALSLLQSLELKHVPHPAAVHLEIGSLLEHLSKPELASGQYLNVLKENPSEQEKRDAQLALSRVKF